MNKQWNEWRVSRAALYGAIIGALNSAFRLYTGQDNRYFDTIDQVSRIGGGAVGGAFVFALIAWARNYFTRPKH